MQEEQIATDLKKKIPEDTKSQLGDGAYPDTESGDPTEHTALPLENYILKQEVSEFLGLPRGYANNPEMVNQLEAVLSWAADLAGTHEINDILHILGRRQGEMGIRNKSDKLQRIYQYAKISKQIDGLYERQKTLYG